VAGARGAGVPVAEAAALTGPRRFLIPHLPLGRFWLKAALLDSVYGDDSLAPLVINRADGVGSTHPNELVAFRKNRNEKRTQLDSDECLFRVAITAKIDFDVDVLSDDYWRYPEERDFYGDGGKFASSSTRANAELEIELTLLINVTTLDVESSEIESIER
jgi:hypothetical protein